MINIRAIYYIPKNIKVISIVLLSLLIVLIVLYIIEQNILIYRNYTIKSDKIDNKMRIVQLTDLHDKYYGKNNKNLISKVKEANPDVIVVTGDMISRDSDENKVILPLLEELTKITDVYYSLGNHENAISNLDEFKQKIKETGTVLLTDEYVNVNIKGNELSIGGVETYAFSEMYTHESFMKKKEKATLFLDDFSSQDNFKLLLCHYPEYFMWRYSEYDIDLTLAGHTHGGSIRIPFIGGLIAPEQGLFPEYDMGYFEKDNGKMIISAGLGSGGIHKVRLNNPGEVTIIDLE